MNLKLIAKFLLLVVLLNVVRYLVGGMIEAGTIMEPMHAPLPLFPEVFDNDFTTADLARSFFYNFMLWLSAAWFFHLLNPVLKGNIWVRSFKAYGLSCLSFISLAAVYMNHYTDAVKPFYFWSMVDALIVFTVVAAANALIFPRLFPNRHNAAHHPD